jgi:hypothetical protein
MDIKEARFVAEYSVRYHRRRSMFLDRFGALLNMVNIISGTSAFVAIISNFGEFAKFLALIVALVNCIQLIFKVEQAAISHKIWLSRWYDALEMLESRGFLRPIDIVNFSKIRNSVEKECVGEMQALKTDCFNRTVRVFGLDSSKLKPLRWHHKIFMHLLPFEHAFSD